MKKFTKIEEDLIKEGLEAQESMINKLEIIENKITEIQSRLDKIKKYNMEPGNGGFPGSALVHVIESLDNTINILDFWK